MVNKKRKSPLQLHLDGKTESLFRQIAEKEVRDLSGQFKFIFVEWLAFKKLWGNRPSPNDMEAGRVGEIEELVDEVLGERGEISDTSKSSVHRSPKQ